MDDTKCYGGAQLSRQNTIYHGKIQFVKETTNNNGKNKNNYCNSKFITARMEQSTHGKTKTLTTKAKRLLQNQIKNGGQRWLPKQVV